MKEATCMWIILQYVSLTSVYLSFSAAGSTDTSHAFNLKRHVQGVAPGELEGNDNLRSCDNSELIALS